jgi:hypothetical protein
MALREVLGNILTQYPSARTKALRDHPIANYIRTDAVDELAAALGEYSADVATALRPKLKLPGSLSQFTEIP